MNSDEGWQPAIVALIDEMVKCGHYNNLPKEIIGKKIRVRENPEAVTISGDQCKVEIHPDDVPEESKEGNEPIVICRHILLMD